MKTPLKDSVKTLTSVGYIKSLLSPQSSLDTYCLYSGACELSLAAAGHSINSYTNAYVVYEFWRCLIDNPEEIHQLVTSPDFSFDSPEYFSVFQERWYTYENKYLRSALFFLLNRCSSDGLISRGTLQQDNYNILAITKIKNFKKPESFSVNYIKQPTQEVSKIINLDTEADYIYVPVGNFSYNLFEDGKSYGPEESRINNRALKKMMNSDKKFILHYNYHTAIQNFYKKTNVTMIDQYGKITTDCENAQEVVVANF
jgi:hypothetical protein